MKDDKKYPYFLITDEEFPRISIVRKKNLNPEKGRYYGPYTDIRAMHATLDFLKKVFPLKQCKSPKFRDRPCLYYHIGRCLAPCQHMVSSEEYNKCHIVTITGIPGFDHFPLSSRNPLVESETILLDLPRDAITPQLFKVSQFESKRLLVCDVFQCFIFSARSGSAYSSHSKRHSRL